MLHKLLDQYLSELESTIIKFDSAYVEQFREDIFNVKRANVRVRIRFDNGFLLEINEAVAVHDDSIEHLNYRYHFQDSRKQLIFRYDNAPHFLALSTSPHHKHLPGQVVTATRPSIAVLAAEVNAIFTRSI